MREHADGLREAVKNEKIRETYKVKVLKLVVVLEQLSPTFLASVTGASMRN